MRDARRLAALVLLAGMTARVGTLRAQAQAPAALFGRTVHAITVTVETRPESSPDVAAAIEVTVGAPFEPAAVRNSIAHLFSLGRFDDVTVRARDANGGVDVFFELSPKHPIDSMRFDGDTGLAPSQLDRLVRQRYAGLPTGSRLRSVAEAVKGMLEDEGYLDATVGTRAEPTHNPDRATLVFAITAGPRTLIRNVTVTGTSPLAPRDVISRTKTEQGEPYRAPAIEAGLAVVRDDLRQRGYYAAEAATETPVFTDHVVDLTLHVDAGPHVTLKFPKDPPPTPVETFVPIEREGSVDEDLLEDSRQNLENGLKALGYWHADVKVSRETTGNELNIVFTITRGLRYRIDHYEITGNAHLPSAAIVQLIGVAAGAPFDEAAVGAGLRSVLAAYLRQGFYSASLVPTLDEPPIPAGATEGRVIVKLAVTEGPDAHIADIVVQGATGIPPGELRAAMAEKPGGPFIGADLLVDRDAILAMYADRGFEAARVAVTRAFSEDQRQATITVAVTEGPQYIVGSISVVGNHRLSEAWIRDQLRLQVGQPFGASARLESRRRLLDSGSFRRVTIDRETPVPGQTRVHVTVTVEESPATTISYGGGVEGGRRPRAAVGGGTEEYFELAPRGFIDITRTNLFGKPRSIDLLSRVSLRPRSAPGDPVHDGRGFGFTEYRVATSYRDRKIFGTDTEMLTGASSEQAVRTDFNFLRKEATIQTLRRVEDHVAVSGQYSLNSTRLFDARIPDTSVIDIARLFPQVRLSIVGTSVSFDNRNDLINPARGMLLSASVEAAYRAIGSQVGYDKAFLQGSLFRSLTASARVVFAGRVQLGLAHAPPRTVVDENGNVSVVDTLPASQRFFAGGGTSVRGFEQDRLGVPELITTDGLSLGGNGLMIVNAELRTRVGKLFGRNFGVVTFTDFGNVFAHAADIRPGALRGAAGFGLRYDSPLGPVRLDFGFKLHRQLIGGRRESAWEYHLNFGEAF